jgi:hypothetical protein
MHGTKNIKYGFFKNVWPCIVTDSLWIKPTDALNSNFIGITTVHVSGSLSAHHQEFLAVHRLWYISCSCDDRLLPGAGWHCHPAPGSKRLRTPDDGQKDYPKTWSVVVPIELEFSASVGLIHKEWSMVVNEPILLTRQHFLHISQHWQTSLCFSIYCG